MQVGACSQLLNPRTQFQALGTVQFGVVIAVQQVRHQGHPVHVAGDALAVVHIADHPAGPFYVLPEPEHRRQTSQSFSQSQDGEIVCRVYRSWRNTFSLPMCSRKVIIALASGSDFGGLVLSASALADEADADGDDDIALPAGTCSSALRLDWSRWLSVTREQLPSILKSSIIIMLFFGATNLYGRVGETLRASD